MILSYVRTAILYLVLIAVVRLMGKRQVGQMEPSEFVVTMLVANLASIPMQDEGIPLFTGLSTTPDNDFNGSLNNNTVECFSVLKLAGDVMLPLGWYA